MWKEEKREGGWTRFDLGLILNHSSYAKKAALFMKNTGVIGKLIGLTMSVNTDSWVPQLAGALLACSALTRNSSEKWDPFFRSVAVGIALAQVTTFEHLWKRCDLLGIR